MFLFHVLPLYQNHMYTDLPLASLEQFLRAIQGSISQAALLTLPPIKLNLKHSCCAIFQVNSQQYLQLWMMNSTAYHRYFNWFPLNFIKERKKESVVAQSCLTLCDPMDCSLRGSSLHGILQARILDYSINESAPGWPAAAVRLEGSFYSWAVDRLQDHQW